MTIRRVGLLSAGSAFRSVLRTLRSAFGGSPARRPRAFRGAVRVTLVGESDASLFFGYHDRSPFDASGSRLLAHRTRFDDRDPSTAGSEIEVGYVALAPDGAQAAAFTTVARTTCWSWQQGSMLQWHPAAPDREIVFNAVVEGAPNAQVWDVERVRLVTTYTRPFYCISSSGRLALSLDFSRLARLRPGYGIPDIADLHAAPVAPEETGLTLVDLVSRSERLLVSLASLASAAPQAGVERHYVNHASFSPDETGVVFFHIWEGAGERRRRVIHLYHYDLASGALTLLETERLVSHYCWLDARRLLVTTRDAHLRWRYTLYDLAAGARTDQNLPLATDGHPMASPANPNLVVTDSPRSEDGRHGLFLADLAGGDASTIATFGVPSGFRGVVRCDLHPRWNRTGTAICVDTAESGRRAMAVLSFSEPL